MSDEQRVRTMAGWIGVEISRSRVRRADRAGYGLYRVRGSVSHRTPAELAGLIEGAVTADGMAERGPWTAYAFTLEEIDDHVRSAIVNGTPSGPGRFAPAPYGDRRQSLGVPTRWTSAYPGRRDLGLGADLEALGRADAAVGAASDRLDETVREIVTRSTVRSRQRAGNDAFQAAHMKARAWGLRQRYAAKTARLARQLSGEQLEPQRGAEAVARAHEEALRIAEFATDLAAVTNLTETQAADWFIRALRG
jgi:hypothetical protein